jgi:hypothetical protein
MFGCSRIMKARADQGVNWMDLWWWRVYSTWVNLGFVFREESEKKKLTWCNRRVSYGLNCFFFGLDFFQPERPPSIGPTDRGHFSGRCCV